MGKHDDPLNRAYPYRIRLISFLTTALIAVLFVLFPRANGESVVYGPPEVTIPEVVQLPPQTVWKQPPRVPRAYIPVNPGEEPVEEPYEEGVWSEIPILEPPPPIPDPGIFIAHTQRPEPVGGYEAIMKNVCYPEMAVITGIQGRVIIQAYIDENGLVRRTRVLKGIPNTGLDEAAVKAVKQTRFHPAMQRDVPVGVWISIPVVFQIR